VLVTAVVRSLRFDPTAYALIAGLRSPLRRAQEAARAVAQDADDVSSPTSTSSTSSAPATRRSLRGSAAGTGPASG
jgi:hypothetical protein